MKTWFVGPKRTYSLSEEDKLWLARAIAGECGEHLKSIDCGKAVAWAMMHRFLLIPGQSAWPTFTNLLRAYCQPINPKWYDDGSICSNPTPQQAPGCKPDHDRHRDRISALTWDNIDKDIRNLVDAFAAGNVTLPDAVLALPHWHISDWAAFHVSTSRRHEEIGFNNAGQVTDLDANANWFFQDKKIMACDVFVVQSDTPPAPECHPASGGTDSGWTTMNTLGVVLALGAAGIAAYLAWARTHS